MSNKASDNLHRLIKSLNKSEKRYFSLYASRHTLGEKNNYAILFEAISKQSEYDEEALLHQFRKEAFINKFSITKGRLYDIILASLDAFHANSSIDAQLKKELHCAEILYKKTLYDQCAKLLMSTKKVATKYERHSSLLEISLWEKKLIETENYTEKVDQDIIKILEEDNLISEKINNYNDYWNIKSRFFMILNKQGKVRNDSELQKFKTIIDNTLLRGEEKALSTETRYLFFHIYSAYFFGIGDYEKSYENLVKNVALIEENPLIFKEEPNIFFSVLTNTIYVGSQLKKYDDVFANLKKLRAALLFFEDGKNEDLEVKLFSSAVSIELTIYLQMGEFEKGMALASKIEEKLLKFEGKFTKLREAYFYFNVAAAYFGGAKYSLALKWINKLLNSPKFEESEDIYCFAQIMSLIIHIELKHDDFVPRSFKNLHRYLSSRNRVYKFENAFLDFIGKVLKTTKREEQAKFYRELKQTLSDLREDSFEKSAFEYFDFLSWVESKIQRVPFRVIVEELVEARK
ncbi:MAG: hypothetical protein M3R27_10215 [Bacteroidota bacterium]|nr:hypothetical protein [Bacteroidota bacterium]